MLIIIGTLNQCHLFRDRVPKPVVSSKLRLTLICFRHSLKPCARYETTSLWSSRSSRRTWNKIIRWSSAEWYWLEASSHTASFLKQVNDELEIRQMKEIKHLELLKFKNSFIIAQSGFLLQYESCNVSIPLKTKLHNDLHHLTVRRTIRKKSYSCPFLTHRPQR